MAYYTPQLRHVQVDAAVGEAAGKKYVYGFFTKPAVKPVQGAAVWDPTNSAWAYPIDAHHKTLPAGACCDACPECSERVRDGEMAS